MAKISTTETKRVNVTVSAPWGPFEKIFSSAREENTLTIKFSFDVLEGTFGRFNFRTTATGTRFSINSLDRLKILHEAMGEAIEEAKKLQGE